MEATQAFEGFYEALVTRIRADVQALLGEQRVDEAMSPWLNVKSAASYLDMTEEALRGLIKRGQIRVHRSETGRVSLRRDDLDAWAQGDPQRLTRAA